MSDTSPEYIKMCEMAEELREKWTPEVGNGVVDKITQNRCVIFEVVKVLHGTRLSYRIRAATQGGPTPRVYALDELIPLWSQEQLQGMMGWSDRQLMKHFRNFLIWITGEDRWDELDRKVVRTMPYGVFLAPFNQLWLAFVMFQLHNKRWTGEGWEVIR